MKVAVLSDVHSNKVALDAVLDELSNQEYDALVCAGDVVGYGPDPRECLETVQEECDYVVQGNHDRKVAEGNFEEYKSNAMAYEGLKYSNEELDDSQIEWLSNLPESTFVTDDLNVVHSHPSITDKYVMPREFPNMRRYMDEYNHIVLGHTHLQHKARVDGRLIINPGSVGQPRDRDWRAAFAILDTDASTVEFHRVEYDVDEVAQRVRKAGLPERTAGRLYEGE